MAGLEEMQKAASDLKSNLTTKSKASEQSKGQPEGSIAPKLNTPALTSSNSVDPKEIALRNALNSLDPEHRVVIGTVV